MGHFAPCRNCRMSLVYKLQIDIMKYNSLISAIPLTWKFGGGRGGGKLISHTSPVDGEIILKFVNGYKNVLTIQYKDYYKVFACIKCECPTALYK